MAYSVEPKIKPALDRLPVIDTGARKSVPALCGPFDNGSLNQRVQ
jgi:hypothetical protein